MFRQLYGQKLNLGTLDGRFNVLEILQGMFSQDKYVLLSPQNSISVCDIPCFTIVSVLLSQSCL